MESGDFAGAGADYERAARLRPHWSQPHSNRGWALVLAGELDQALRAFSSALALEPGDALALYGRQAVATRRNEAANGQVDIPPPPPHPPPTPPPPPPTRPPPPPHPPPPPPPPPPPLP